MASASPASSADTAQQWCSAYTTITEALAAAGTTEADAKNSLEVLNSFDQLWAAGQNLGYLTSEESDANRRAVVAYAALVQVIADGKAPDSAESKTARDNLTAVTTKDTVLLTSSGQKVTALCSPFAAPASSASAAPSASAGQ